MDQPSRRVEHRRVASLTSAGPAAGDAGGSRILPRRRRVLWVASVCLAWAAGCGPSLEGIGQRQRTVIRVEGSDTMVNIAQAWAEEYHKKHSHLSIQVLGGGSGVGIASLIDGNCDLANTSRKMSEQEIQKVRDAHGVEPIEHIVGQDALAVYVHPANPLERISMDQLAEIFGDGGTITHWSQLGVTGLPGRTDKIIRVSRQNSSGTYAFFRETVLGKKRDLKLGSLDANGSKDAVALVSRTPLAIGYTGMGYLTPEVKALKVISRGGTAGVAPSVPTANDGSYPLTRPLQIYTVGEPTGIVGQYLQWIRAPEGQQVVFELDYVPLAEQKHE